MHTGHERAVFYCHCAYLSAKIFLADFLCIFLCILPIIILFVFSLKNKNEGNIKKSTTYKKLIFIVILAGILLFLATSGRFILPQLMQVLKMVLPLMTKLIGI